MGQSHLTQSHREILVRLLEQGYSQRKMANILGYSQATISKEFKRNKNYEGIYLVKTAQYKATLRRQQASRKTKKQYADVVSYVQTALKQFWSPEQIAGRMDYEGSNLAVCFATIYRWLKKGSYAKKGTVFTKYARYLRIKGHCKSWGKSKRSSRGETVELPNIALRIDDGYFGHWECDLVHGFNRSGYLLTVVERQTGLLYIALCKQKSVAEVNKGLIDIFSKIPKRFVKTLTFDRGKEFYGYKEIEKQLSVKCYFCNAYSPYEKGLNENTNGLLRQFFPRTRAFDTITEDEMLRAVKFLNHRPKKKFDYKSTVEVVKESGLTEVITFS